MTPTSLREETSLWNLDYLSYGWVETSPKSSSLCLHGTAGLCSEEVSGPGPVRQRVQSNGALNNLPKQLLGSLTITPSSESTKHNIKTTSLHLAPRFLSLSVSLPGAKHLTPSPGRHIYNPSKPPFHLKFLNMSEHVRLDLAYMTLCI